MYNNFMLKTQYFLLYFVGLMLVFDLFKLTTNFFSYNKYIEPASTLFLFVLFAIPLIKNKLQSFLLIFITFLIEVIGLNFGFIFGAYSYNQQYAVFGMFGVPIFIAFAWFIIIASLKTLTNSAFLTAFFAVIIDICLEEYALIKSLWQWDTSGLLLAPNKNYIAWFVISFFGYFLLKRNKPSKGVALATIVMLLCSIGFYLLLYGPVIYGAFALFIALILVFLYFSRTKKISFSF